MQPLYSIISPMNISVFPTEKVTREAALCLDSIFAAQKDKPFLFLSSGGSSLGILDYLNPDNFGPESTVCVLDERYSTDPTLNNFAQIEKTNFFKQIQRGGANFIDTKPRVNESMNAVASRFEKDLRDWVTTTGGAIIASIGVGPDAHTSGIMPYPENPTLFQKTFNDESHWVVAYDAENKNPQKIGRAHV